MRFLVGLLLGPLLGALLGGAVGWGFFKLGAGGALLWVAYGLCGAVTGFFCGKPVWQHDTLWTPVLKSIVGFIVGVGLYALWERVLGDPLEVGPLKELGLHAPARVSQVPFALGALIGLVWGTLVGLDDALGAPGSPRSKKG